MHVRFDIAILLGMAGVAVGVFAIGCCPDPPSCKELTLQEIEALPEDERRAALECLTECDPNKSSRPVGNFCGVFVSSTKGNDENDGTQEKPFRTVKKALEILPSKPPPKDGAKASIYLCAEQFMEEVTLSSGIVVVGGLDCNAPHSVEWVYNVPNVETVLTAPEGKAPLRLVSGEGMTEIHDVHVLAMSVPDTMPGGSSIAVIADDAEALFERSIIEAGNGAKGMDGASYVETATEGAPGKSGNVACAMAPYATEGPENKCETASSLGGSGGPGGTHSGSAGGPGEPDTTANGGSGETSDVSSVCSDGEPGAEGTPGGAGDDATGLGTLDRYVGHIGVRGTDGKPGTPGQGGGGGGGAKSKVGNVNQCSGGMGYGASGGSGGAGGCGGAEGKGGDPGGSSIAVVSIKSKLSFSVSTIKVGSGGAPGNGSPGQEGGAGGVGAAGGEVPMGVNLKPACAGGTGGKGGSGGPGGKGLGGHMIGIAYSGHEPEFVDISIFIQQGTKDTGGIKAKTQPF